MFFKSCASADCTARLQIIKWRGERQRKFVQMMLEFAVAPETQAAHDANDGRGIGLQPLGHRPHAQQHVFAGMLQNRADNFLPLSA
jgi:hypothetical protein